MMGFCKHGTEPSGPIQLAEELLASRERLLCMELDIDKGPYWENYGKQYALQHTHTHTHTHT
jgi:hypothetical protein